jgi:hypothetical protein
MIPGTDISTCNQILQNASKIPNRSSETPIKDSETGTIFLFFLLKEEEEEEEEVLVLDDRQDTTRTHADHHKNSK